MPFAPDAGDLRPELEQHGLYALEGRLVATDHDRELALGKGRRDFPTRVRRASWPRPGRPSRPDHGWRPVKSCSCRRRPPRDEGRQGSRPAVGHRLDGSGVRDHRNSTSLRCATSRGLSPQRIPFATSASPLCDVRFQPVTSRPAARSRSTARCPSSLGRASRRSAFRHRSRSSGPQAIAAGDALQPFAVSVELSRDSPGVAREQLPKWSSTTDGRDRLDLLTDDVPLGARALRATLTWVATTSSSASRAADSCT